MHKERETVVIEHERKKLMQVPIHSVSGLFCFGNVLVSPALMGFCGEKGVNLAFLRSMVAFMGVYRERNQAMCSLGGLSTMLINQRVSKLPVP